MNDLTVLLQDILSRVLAEKLATHVCVIAE